MAEGIKRFPSDSANRYIHKHRFRLMRSRHCTYNSMEDKIKLVYINFSGTDSKMSTSYTLYSLSGRVLIKYALQVTHWQLKVTFVTNLDLTNPSSTWPCSRDYTINQQNCTNENKSWLFPVSLAQQIRVGNIVVGANKNAWKQRFWSNKEAFEAIVEVKDVEQ